MSKKIIVISSLSFLIIGIVFSIAQNKSNAQIEQNLGSQTLVRFSEDFDSVTAPNFPSGWTVSSTGTGAGFVTTSDTPESSPNTAFTESPATTSSTSLTSPQLFIFGSDTRLNFRHRYSLENSWDGAVLEIKIGDGQFVDILDAGGQFLVGGYTTILNPSTNILQNRFAWSGGNQGLFADASVKLPPASFRQSVQFRWVLGTNDSFGVEGWRIDNITLEEVPTGLNTNEITISDNNPASPYPSEIEVSGLQGLLTGIVVNIENFSHQSPDDVDILLVSPTGRSIVLMSDAGGTNEVNNLTLTFDDKANSDLPDETSIVTGIYKTSNYEGGDVYPNPAPQTSPSTTFSSFYGDTPNGIWSLYVVDDNGNSVGTIAEGWNMSLQSSVNACFFTVDPLFASFSHLGGSSNFEITTPDGCPWTATINNSFINFDSTMSNDLSGIGSGIVNFNVEPNMAAAKTGLITISDGFTNRTFQIQQASGCPFSIAENSLSITSNGGAESVAVEAGGVCVWNASTEANWIEITSTEQTGNGTALFNILPNTTGIARSAVVSIGARNLTINQLATSSSVRFDFDGDGKSDISVYRDGVWFLQQSTAGFAATQFGLASDKITPADFDGDGKTDISVFRDGIWYVLKSTDGQFFSVQFGQTGDIPTPADFNGDGRAELGIFRDGIWFTFDLTNNQSSQTQFGIANDKPVAADYDGDGNTDFAVYRDGIWFLQQSTAGNASVQFGIATDVPVIGDYNGDSKSDIAVYRNGEWHVLTEFQNYSVSQFGISTDAPTPADYDGDGKSDLAIYRDGVWYILQSSNGQSTVSQFGLANDQPVPNAFVP